MNYLFNNIERNIIQKLRNSEPKGIWTEFVRVIFEFENFYIEIDCLPEKADSQNIADEAMTVKIRENIEKYQPNEQAIKIKEKNKITDIKIARTLLYFTDSITETYKVKKLDSKWNRMLSKISGVRKSEIDKLLEGTSSSYHSQIICRPDSEESKNSSAEYSNLIDVGIIVEFDNQYLPALVQANAFGFGHLEIKPLLTSEEIKSSLNKYELI
ncbi:MAG: hypothetical protein HKP48_03940 [Winogradskyella sp.]|uniref:hypothetical protein n=1 Tax=Winogradskyella sp. TaxID=1883156 RepID=UPI0017F46C25|nr:hypothetical protein [Winogradskyella sp.]MBT8245087.1 hypothetical protein [Winogradskyella sp.]NNK22451.1 hypothetical protein [Winogradskyella sp.]